MEKHGHWIRWGWSVRCSCCNYNDIGGPNYCQNCGAKMDEPEVWDMPSNLFDGLELPKFINCPECKESLLFRKEQNNYCPYCGVLITKMNME